MLNNKSKFDKTKEYLKEEWEDYQALRKKFPKKYTMPNPMINFIMYDEIAQRAGEWQGGRRKAYLGTLIAQRVLKQSDPREMVYEIQSPDGWEV